MIRIIPKLDIKGPNLVKGIHLEGLRVLGKPEAFARFYYESGADELLYMDAVASLYGRNSLLDIVARTAGEVLIPLCVGGGLRTVEDIRTVLRAAPTRSRSTPPPSPDPNSSAKRPAPSAPRPSSSPSRRFANRTALTIVTPIAAAIRPASMPLPGRFKQRSWERGNFGNLGGPGRNRQRF